jgi:2-C-methyl-D-erythritol 4-phosphate cytidylyltransferase
MGARPRLVQGSATNIKITYPEDLRLAAAILAAESAA